ncbi:penicillin acylase family protein [Halobacterium zhouii]|uniref:penicillin acylase family protein n=1 Tax=Halobacterium zhouii TaxID=2902624 RepID=UPI001E533300|nr:penicillin acylase family protein [Halobacterium zhouii]
MDDVDKVRRGLVAAVLGGVAAGGLFSPAASYLERFAPLSGDVWRATTDDLPGSVSSPYGDATLSYDDHRVPRVSADDERALYYAVGFAQGTDRLFQMDIQRRQMRGQIAEIVGEAAVSSDEFHARMDFARAADTNWSALQNRNPTVAGLTEAFAEGVNAAREQNRLPPEFELLDYEPAPWTPADTMLMQLQISWTLTGSFETLRRARLRDALGGGHEELFPRRYDHDSPILGGGLDGGSSAASERRGERKRGRARTADPTPDAALTGWLSGFESPNGVGSNSWVVGGEHTESGKPIVANDPHLSLMAPPVWYQQHLAAGDYDVRGVTFPGVPFVIIGENQSGAWGFTNVGADVLDCYTYEIDRERYRYDGEWREFDTEDHTIAVRGADDVTVTKRKTVHGPLLEREAVVGGSGSDDGSGNSPGGDSQRVGVAWTGLSATATTDAIYAFARSSGLDDVRAATRDFELPTQNLVYADREGNTYYKATGRIPIRRVDGEEVPGWRVFDGSAGEGEWAGFEPYGESSWEGFVPFEEKPGAVNPGYVATANQRVVDDPEHYFAESYSPPFRGERIYELLDEWTGRGRGDGDGTVTPADMRDLQRDALDTRARRLVPRLLDAVDVESAGAPFAALANWDYRMVQDSEGALAFAVFLDAYRRELYASGFDAAGLDEGYWPGDWVTVHLEDGDDWFDRGETPASATAAMRSALDAASERVASTRWETYGDYNVVALEHPFDQSFLNYPEMPTDGSPATVNNYRRDSDVGSSWRMVVPMAGESQVVLPGGNAGDPFSEQYHDQLAAWAADEYLPFDREFDERTVQFRGER